MNRQRKFSITLKENSQLDEVIVVGYGQQKKASVVGAITQASGKVLERSVGIPDVGSALTGNLPGVITTASSGMPGEEEPQIVIRGSSTWNNSAPLVLVDGIERPMSGVDMASVENISVLKDASATAVYGVKGANGVILVTTKGYELSLRFNKVLNNKMRFWAEMNMTHAKNTIDKKDDAELLPAYQKQAGYSINQNRAWLDKGFLNTYDEIYGSPKHNSSDNMRLPGDYYIIDYNGDGVIDDKDQAPYGYSSTPQNSYSATLGWEWKGFSVFAQFDAKTCFSDIFYTTGQNWKMPGTCEAMMRGPIPDVNGTNWNMAKTWGTKIDGLVEHDKIIHQPTANYVDYAYDPSSG